MYYAGRSLMTHAKMSVVAWQMFPLGLQLFDGPTEPSAKHGCKNVRMKFVNLLKCENGTKFLKKPFVRHSPPTLCQKTVTESHCH